MPRDLSPLAARLATLVSELRTGALITPAEWTDLVPGLERIARTGALPDDGWRDPLSRRGGTKRALADAAANLLVSLGVWDGHDDVRTLLSVLPEPFTTQALADIRPEPDVPADVRTISLPLLTIDGPDPLEVDDALHAARDGDDLIVTVAIAHPSAYIRAGGPLDAAVAARGATYYHPRYTTPMMPERVAVELASLTTGVPRLALVAQIRVDPGGVARTEALFEAWVQVAAAIGYADADARVAAGDESDVGLVLRCLWEAAQRSENYRIQRGAWLLYRTATDVKAPPFQPVSLRTDDQATPARRIVGEAMVLYGQAIARFCQARGVPAPFRVQPPPTRPPLPPGLYSTQADIRSMLRHLGPASFSTVAGSHAVLALDAYVQASSPLRRYVDLLAQRQVVATLRGKPAPYDASALKKAAGKADSRVRSQRRDQRRAERYFTLLHVIQLGLGTRFDAQLVEDIQRRGRVLAWIDSISLEVELSSYAGSVGEDVVLSVEGVDLSAQRLTAAVVEAEG